MFRRRVQPFERKLNRAPLLLSITHNRHRIYNTNEMATECEFILIVTLPRRYHRSREFGDNTHSGKFFAFKRRLRISTPLYFPGGLDQPNTDQSSKYLSAHLCAIATASIKEYVAIGCQHGGYFGSLVDIKSMREVKPAIASSVSIYNFVVCDGVVVMAADSRDLFVARLDTPESERLRMADVKLSSSDIGSRGLNCGRHMLLDGHMAYLFCSAIEDTIAKLTRLSLKGINPTALNTCESTIKVQDILTTTMNASFYVTARHIYVIELSKFTRIDKISLKSRVMAHQLSESTEICQIVGTDRYVYAARGDAVLLLKIGDSKLSMIDEVKNDAIQAELTRSLISARSSTGVNFVIRLQEKLVGVAIYSALRSRLHLLASQLLDPSDNDRILGGLYDARNGRIIACMEEFKSQVVKLTY